MKRVTLGFLFMTGLTGVAHSETSATLYGIVDAGVAYQKTKITQGNSWVKNRNLGFKNGLKSPNRWGLKGVEDLGNGTNAIFQLESGFELGDGRSNFGGRLFGRHAYMGLQNSSWGTLTLGRQYNVAGDIIPTLDPFVVSYGQAGVLRGAFGNSVLARMDNSIKYITPNLNGFKFGIGYAGKNSKSIMSDGVDSSEENNTSSWVTVGANYNAGPIAVSASYDKFHTDRRNSDIDLKGTTHMWNIFGAYDFEFIKLHLGYGQSRGAMSNPVITEYGIGGTGLNSELKGLTTINDPSSSFYEMDYIDTNGYRQQAWMLGLTAPIGAKGKVLFSYQGNETKNTSEAFDGIKGKIHIFSLGYIHSISKRTNIYALASYGSGRLNFDKAQTAKLESTLVSVGLQHHF